MHLFISKQFGYIYTLGDNAQLWTQPLSQGDSLISDDDFFPVEFELLDGEISEQIKEIRQKLITAEDKAKNLEVGKIKREHAIEQAQEYFEFEGMSFDNDGGELDTVDEVEEKAVKFLESKGYEIIK